jgi:hypothetical protein
LTFYQYLLLFNMMYVWRHEPRDRWFFSSKFSRCRCWSSGIYS